MTALVLKSKNSLAAGVAFPDFAEYKRRVLADGGFIYDEQAVIDAMLFSYANNIRGVFSATSARWGVKLDGLGKPAKFYSLFNPLGDVEAVSLGSGHVAYDESTFAFPVLNLTNPLTSVLGAFKSKVINGVNNAGTCLIARTPSVGGGYGNRLGFTVGALQDQIQVSPNPSEIDKDRVFTSTTFARANSTDNNPENWWSIFGSNNANGEVSTSGLLTGMGVWQHTSSFNDNTGLYVYNNGSLLASDNSVTAPVYKDNMAFEIGRVRSTNNTTGALAYTNSFYGFVAEAWCLVNTSKESMLALSLRASQQYSN